jgi:hypothetical protein
MMRAMQHDLELKPTASGRAVLAIFGAALVGLAILLGVLAAQPHQHVPFGILAAFGVAGALMLVLAIRIGARRLILDGEGVEVRGLLGRKRIAWLDIQGYSFASIDAYAQTYGQGGLVGVLAVAAVKAMRKKPANRKFLAGRLVLFGAGGSKLTINAWFRDIDQGLERIFATLHPRLQATTGTAFGKLSFDGHAIGHPSKGQLPLVEVDKISVSPNGIVAIRKAGKRLAWASVTMGSITSSLLLFERLAQRGVIVEMSDAVFLPLPTLGLLNQLAAARQNLPQARIQQR